MDQTCTGPSIIPIACTFSRLHLADYPCRRNVDGFLRLTHGFCLERSSPVQAGPTGTCVYTASQARLGGPIFTPRCFPKKTSSRGPSPKVHHTENHTYRLMFLLSCCMLQLHTYYDNTETQYRTLWQRLCMATQSNIFFQLTRIVSAR